MGEEFEDALRSLHEFIALEKFKNELKEAKQSFWKMTGAPLVGEPIEELRLGSFIEWFSFDRQLKATRRTPVEEYMRTNADSLSGEPLEIFRGFSQSVHSIFQVYKVKHGLHYLKDFYTGIKYCEVQRVPISLGKGDTVELRLIPVNGIYYCTDGLCFHPFVANKKIISILKTARKEGEPVAPVLLTLMRMNTRYEHSPKTSKAIAYDIP
jgi:hypothetical protein